MLLTAVLRYGGGCANMNSSAFNKLCAGRQFSVSNPPQRKARNRYRTLYLNSKTNKRIENILFYCNTPSLIITNLFAELIISILCVTITSENFNSFCRENNKS